MQTDFIFPAEYIELAKKMAKGFDDLTWQSKKARVSRKITTKKWTARSLCGVAHSTDFPLYISPCGKFLLKHGYISSRARHDGVPTDHLIPSFFSEEVRFGHYQWVLQPIADVSSESCETAMNHFKEVPDLACDLHMGNVAMWNNKPCLIDF